MKMPKDINKVTLELMLIVFNLVRQGVNNSQGIESVASDYVRKWAISSLKFNVCRYYNNVYGSSGYYSQSRMLHDAGLNLGDWDLMGLVTKAIQVYKQLNEEDED